MASKHHKSTKPNRSRGSGRYTPPQAGPRHGSAGARIRDVAVAVLDHEVFELAPELFPTTFDWEDPEDYLAFMEEQIEAIAESGDMPWIVFIDPVDYLEWCEDENIPVDSSQSRAGYAAAVFAEGYAMPYESTDRLWSLSVLSMAVSSDVWEDTEDDEFSFFDDWIDQYTDFVLTAEGRYRTIATASRLRVRDDTVLWQHFRDAVKSQVRLTYCPDYLSVVDIWRHEHNTLFVDDYGNVDPIVTILQLSMYGHGIVGIEHRDGDAFTFRAFEFDRNGWRAIPTSVLGNRLGTPNAPSLRYGFEFDRS